MKIYHQQRAELSIMNQGIDFILGGNNSYHQIGNAYFEFDISHRTNTGDFNNVVGGIVYDSIRLVKTLLLMHSI